MLCRQTSAGIGKPWTRPYEETLLLLRCDRVGGVGKPFWLNFTDSVPAGVPDCKAQLGSPAGGSRYHGRSSPSSDSRSTGRKWSPPPRWCPGEDRQRHGKRPDRFGRGQQCRRRRPGPNSPGLKRILIWRLRKYLTSCGNHRPGHQSPLATCLNRSV